MYTLFEINTNVKGTLHGIGEMPYSFFITDSRQVIHTEEVLFFALVSDRNDAHRYIDELIEKGVKAFVVSNKEFIRDTASFILVNDTLQALQDLAAHHRSQFNIPVIGITGSNGKTIVKEWLYQLLKEDKTICRSPKSYNSQIGVPLSVLNLNKTHQLAIFEAGISLPGEMQKLHNIIKPTLGILTSLGQAHDEGFKNREQKFAEKWKLFAGTEKVIVNKYDDPTLAFSENRAITIGSGSDCTYKLNYILGTESSTIELTPRTGKKEIFSIPFIDKASVLNCSTCIVTLLHLGYASNVIQKNLLHLQSIALRLEVKNAINNSIIINDFYNSDIDSIRIALSFLNQQHRREKKVVIVSDIEQSGRREEELYAELANLLKQNKVDVVVGIGNAITANKDLFGSNALFYADAQTFLNDEKARGQLHNSSILLKGANRFNFEHISKAFQLKSHDTILEIDLNKLTHNINHYRSLITKPTQLMCMVKAMGYGSGSSEIAKTLQHIGVNYLAVAYADEGVELRDASITLPIMVMSPERDSFEDIIKYNLEPEIYSFKLLEDLIHALDKLGIQETFPIHLKIDTGMKRLGFESEDMDALCEKLKRSKQIKVKSIFSHLVGTDNKEFDRFTQQQIELFKAAADKVEKAVGYITIKHICNSGGITRFKNAHFNMVRLGIGMYGFGVNEDENALLQNVNTLKTRISQIKKVKADQTVGYSRNGVAATDLIIATIPIGYADGFHRSLGNGNHGVWINNKFCKTIGNICMDMCMVDITNVKCEEGDVVIVFENSAQVNQMAKAMNSIAYEVLTGISARVKRVYTQE